MVMRETKCKSCCPLLSQKRFWFVLIPAEVWCYSSVLHLSENDSQHFTAALLCPAAAIHCTPAGSAKPLQRQINTLREAKMSSSAETCARVRWRSADKPQINADTTSG